MLIPFIIYNHSNQKKLFFTEKAFFTDIFYIEKIELKNFTFEDIARFTIASIMNQKTKIITITKKGNLYFATYVRKSDKKKFDYKIKFDNNKIIWANIDGRWRNSPYDEKITFIESKKTISIIQTFSDGSRDVQKYKVGD